MEDGDFPVTVEELQFIEVIPHQGIATDTLFEKKRSQDHLLFFS
jgi:hypothetical protein